jgi:hypothetical protein
MSSNNRIEAYGSCIKYPESRRQSNLLLYDTTGINLTDITMSKIFQSYTQIFCTVLPLGLTNLSHKIEGCKDNGYPGK